MAVGRIRHDAAVNMAKVLLDAAKPPIRQEEWKAAYQQFYQICRAGIEAIEAQQNRLTRNKERMS